MPINFTTTFVQPVLAELDAGRVTNASDWARLITQHYIATIKTGMPNGIPPSLPSPPQNGAPAPLGNSPYNTIDSKKGVMESIIRAYFTAKEVDTQKVGIRGTIQTIKRLVIKARNLKQQIESLIDQANIITKEINSLPDTLQDLYKLVLEEIQIQIDQTRQLVEALDKFKLQINDPQFDQVFSQELSLINDIKNFKFSFNVDTLQKLISLTQGIDGRVAQLQANLSSTNAFKVYILQSLQQIVGNTLMLVNTAVSPTQYISYYSNLAQRYSNYKLIVQRIKRIKFINNILRPRLKKIKERLDAKRRDLQDIVESDIKEQKDTLKKRKDDLAKKKGEGRDQSYKKAKSVLNRYRKQYKKELNDKRQGIKRITESIKLANRVLTKIGTIYLGINEEIKTFITQLPNINTSNMLAQASIENDVKLLLKENNLHNIANEIALLFLNVKTDAELVRNFFLQKNSTAMRYLVEIKTLIRKDIPSLYKTIFGGDNTQSNTPIDQGGENANYIGVLGLLENKIETTVNGLLKRSEARLKKEQKSVEERLSKQEKDITDIGINLIPVQSSIEDKKNKKRKIQEKKATLKQKQKQLKKLKKIIQCSTVIARGSIQIFKNFSTGEISFSRNQQPLNDVINGFLDFRSINSETRTQTLQQDKQRFRRKLDTLQVIEGLVTGIQLLAQEIQADPNFTSKWNSQVLANIKNQQPLEFYTKLGEVLQSPTQNPKELLPIANQLTEAILQDKNTIENIANIERNYKLKVLQLFNSLGQGNNYAGVFFRKVAQKISGDRSIILFLLRQIIALFKKFKTFIQSFTRKARRDIGDSIEKRKRKIQEDAEKYARTLKEKATNKNAGGMSLAFSLATRAVWSGATWTGPTGTVFTTTSIGPFKPLKATVEGGLSGLIKEIAASFEQQLKGLSGTAVNTPAGIGPIPFTGYS